MDNENALHIYYGMPFTCKDKLNKEYYMKMFKPREAYAEQDNLDPEIQGYIFSLTCSS